MEFPKPDPFEEALLMHARKAVRQLIRSNLAIKAPTESLDVVMANILKRTQGAMDQFDFWAEFARFGLKT